jgi:hypothetical protein
MLVIPRLIILCPTFFLLLIKLLSTYSLCVFVTMIKVRLTWCSAPFAQVPRSICLEEEMNVRLNWLLLTRHHACRVSWNKLQYQWKGGAANSCASICGMSHYLNTSLCPCCHIRSKSVLQINTPSILFLLFMFDYSSYSKY